MRVTCPKGLTVVYCGNKNTQTKNAENYRRAIPINSTTCECYDYFGMQCDAWCTKAPLRGFEIASVTSSGTFDSSCSSGNKALGCHMAPVQYEQWPAFYPSTNGSGCTCYNYFGVQCTALCASNVIDYEINLIVGSGYLVSTCKITGNKVLGCGSDYDAQYSGGVEKFRYTRVYTSTSCMCYDYYHVKCYSICGKLI
jgi:hypothetical protein